MIRIKKLKNNLTDIILKILNDYWKISSIEKLKVFYFVQVQYN